MVAGWGAHEDQAGDTNNMLKEVSEVLTFPLNSLYTLHILTKTKKPNTATLLLFRGDNDRDVLRENSSTPGSLLRRVQDGQHVQGRLRFRPRD
jgi:hypothetical protein